MSRKHAHPQGGVPVSPHPAAPGGGDRPDVKRLGSTPVVITGAALLFVVLAVAFLVTSRPKPDANAPVGFGAQGVPEGPAPADFLNVDPDAQPLPCQGLECAALAAGGQLDPPSDPPTAPVHPPPTDYYGPAPSAGVPATDPYAVTYGPEPGAVPAQPECGRSCRFRQARASRLAGDAGTAGTGSLASSPGAQFHPGPDGLLPDGYYAGLADSMLRAELSAYGAVGSAPHSGRNAGGTSQLATAPAVDGGRAAPAPQVPPTPSSPYVVSAGTLIPAALVTGINSDLCGDVKAAVTRDVYDARQRVVLIPAGAELLGTCSDQVAAGQARLAVAWTRLRFPDGRTLALPGLPTHSSDGRSGVRDRVNNHWGRVFGTAVLLSAIGAGAQLAIPQETVGGSPSPVQTAATAAAAELSTLATEILRRNLEVKPTLEIRPATPFVVFVAADLDVGAPAPRPRSGGER